MREIITKLLAFHIVLSLIEWTITVNYKNDFQIIMNSIISVTLMIVWYSAICSFRDQSFFKSFLVSLFFTIPSFIFGAAFYYSNLEIGNPFTLFAYFGIIFNMPFSMGYGVLSDVGLFTQITMPAIVLNLLLLLNYAEYIFLKIRRRQMLAKKDETSDSLNGGK